MPTVFTGATSAAGSGQLTNQVITAYDRSAYFALRDESIWDQLVDVKPGSLTNPGTPVSFLFWSDMAEATTALSETVDVEPVGLSDSTVTVTPAEYGNAVLVTIRIRTDDYLVGFDSDVSNLLNENMVKSLDSIARATFDSAGSERTQDGGAEGSLSSDELTAADVRKERVALKKAFVSPISGDFYVAVIHPDVAYDLKAETGDAAWLGPRANVNSAELLNDEIGTFAGFKFLETARTKVTADGGAGTEDTYRTYFLGKQAVAKVESIAPHMVLGPVTDTLMRFRPLGWHAYLGYGQFRSAALRRVVTTSTLST